MNQSEESIGDQRGVPVNEGPLWENEAHEPPLPGTEVASQRILVTTAWGPPTHLCPAPKRRYLYITLHINKRIRLPHGSHPIGAASDVWKGGPTDTPRMNRSSE